jgi:hypothetical protein
MNDDAIQDLKQFIAATVSQQTSGLATKLDVERLESKMDDLSSAVAEALDTSSDAAQSQISDHESRISKLEQKFV